MTPLKVISFYVGVMWERRNYYLNCFKCNFKIITPIWSYINFYYSEVILELNNYIINEKNIIHFNDCETTEKKIITQNNYIFIL